ncbi:hypothetical protein Tsubulata_021375 [Turnera subulata]|uniref:KAT8 regulatory NSL complex subunit 2 n=1 Tax=Turnera subulata TaxID=218843 RepID=A0A9Q0G142_9ROSI|nr:hypothetical protein Tsubulata_021375 [Turnera subulata]
MASASKHHHSNHLLSISKPPKTPAPNSAASATLSTTTATQTTTNNVSNPNPSSASAPPITPSIQDQYLSRATHLTRQELLNRRSHSLRQLSRCYRDHYWALMEELKIQYREYYWKFGMSPFKEDHQQRDDLGLLERGASGDGNNNNNNNNNTNHIMEVTGENNNSGSSHVNGSSSLDLKTNHRCLFVGCKLKAMALTSFCHLHILSDSKQKLYKPCGYVIKRSSAPSLCSVHFQKAQKHVTRALKKAGLNVSSSSKLAPKFHVIVAEYVRQIQTKRRAAMKGNKNATGRISLLDARIITYFMIASQAANSQRIGTHATLYGGIAVVVVLAADVLRRIFRNADITRLEYQQIVEKIRRNAELTSQLHRDLDGVLFIKR